MARKRRFSRDINDFITKTGFRADVVLRKVGLDAFAGVLQHSPVDQGRFRGNWRIGINETDLTITEDVPARSAGTKHKDPPTPAEVAYGNVAVLSAEFGDTIHITNNLPYAKRLEEGYSDQAKGGVVEPTFVEITTDFAQTVKTIRAS
jgi:hypothetical protein